MSVWITHPETGGVVEVDEAAVPMYRQSGWDLLPEKDVAKRAKAAADEAAADEARMVELGRVALGQVPPPPTPEPPPEVPVDSDAKSTKKENG
jgi:uncharacterized membrane protein